MPCAFCQTGQTCPTCQTILRKKRSIRQIDPAFVAAVAGRIGRFVDQFRKIVEHAAISLRVVVIDERLPTDHLDPALSAEKLTGDTALLLKINEFEHNSSLSDCSFAVLFENHAQDPDFGTGIFSRNLIPGHGFGQGIPQGGRPGGPGRIVSPDLVTDGRLDIFSFRGGKDPDFISRMPLQKLIPDHRFGQDIRQSGAVSRP